MNEIHLGQVLEWKYGACADTMGGKITKWYHPTIPQPDEIQLEADRQEYISYQASILFQKKRALEYPSIEDQLDAIWKGGDEMEAMRTTILEVKNKYPKPGVK